MTTHILYWGTAERMPDGTYEQVETYDIEYYCGNFCYDADVSLLTSDGFIEAHPNEWIGPKMGDDRYLHAQGGAHPAPSWPDYDVLCGWCSEVLYHHSE